MKKLIIFFFISFLLGCNEKTDTEVLMVEQFWTSVTNNDVAGMKGLVSDTEYNRSFGKDSGFSGFSLIADIKVGKKLENGNVSTTIKRFCYPEYSIETVLLQNKGKKFIDGNATFMNIFNKSKNLKPLKKYCYSFKNRKMSGKIQGEAVTLNFLNEKTVDFGTHKEQSFKLTSKKCKKEGCVQSKTPMLLISNLKLDSEGGNFTPTENITLYNPITNHNEIITTGSYRIGSTNSGKKRLEISFEEDKDNFINGYIDY